MIHGHQNVKFDHLHYFCIKLKEKLPKLMCEKRNREASRKILTDTSSVGHKKSYEKLCLFQMRYG